MTTVVGSIGVEKSSGFAAIEHCDARVLLLGSLPGQKSIAEQQYYAHPQNVFWPIMAEIYGIRGDYADRCAQLIDAKLALWDVLAASVRPGSLDADIEVKSAEANDFAAFLRQHSSIELIAFNGKKAEQLFHRLVLESLQRPIRLIGLPSTSPAYASLSYSGKLAAWRNSLGAIFDQ